MKKLFFPILFLTVTFLHSCDYANDRDDLGYKPTQVLTETYQLTDADYKTINQIAKTAANSKYASDSVSIMASNNTTEYKDSVLSDLKDTLAVQLTRASNILSNLSFSDKELASNYVQYLLPSLYPYCDPNSAIKICYRTTETLDATAYKIVAKSILTVDSLKPMNGIKYFSTTTNPNTYLPAYCQLRRPYAQVNDVFQVSFPWYVNASTTVTLTRYYVYNGSTWSETGKTDQFIKGSDYSWVFDPTITFVASATDYKLVLSYLYNKFLDNGGVAPVAPATVADTIKFRIPEIEGYNGWTETSFGRFIINWKYPPSGSDISNVRTEYFFGTSWYYPDVDVRSTARTYADDVDLHKYFDQIDNNADLSTDQKSAAKSDFLEKRVINAHALLLSLKYPNLMPQVKGIDQYVQVKIDEYNGSHNYWTYRYQCKEKGKYEYVSRTKWK